MSSKVKINTQEELQEFVRTHLGHRLTALVSPVCRPENHACWNGRNDAYRAAKEGSYVMLRLFIEFLGVKGDEKTKGRLIADGGKRDDDLRLAAFSKWGVKNVKPEDFKADQSFIADMHRKLCKINAHFTYDSSKADFYDRIASPPDSDWEKAVEIVVGRLEQDLYQRVRQPIVVHSDLVREFKTTFPCLNSNIQGDGLGRKDNGLT